MIITRFAPSPTGFLHIGGVRTAIFSYLWAKNNNGKFLLRIEDTDKKRNSQEATQEILKAFKWLNIEINDDIVYQSQRDDIYAKYIKQLLDEDKAYYCYMSKDELDTLREEQQAKGERSHYNGKYRDFNGEPPKGVNPVVRIKAEKKNITVNDGVKGEVIFPADQIDDFIIARSDGSPTYNFVVAIDDYLMKVSDVIRGDDHLSNTPKQILVYEALGFDIPNFFHIPMILNEKGKKLSKRDNASNVMDYKDMGYFPEALLNYLVRLGWSSGDQEIFSLEAMIDKFNPNDINKSASAINSDKLLWLNSHYLKNFSNADICEKLGEIGVFLNNNDKIDILLNSIKERAKTLLDIKEIISTILNEPSKYNAKDIKKHI
jgi:glutamyl-tRNA synthetase